MKLIEEEDESLDEDVAAPAHEGVAETSGFALKLAGRIPSACR